MLALYAIVLILLVFIIACYLRACPSITLEVSMPHIFPVGSQQTVRASLKANGNTVSVPGVFDMVLSDTSGVVTVVSSNADSWVITASAPVTFTATVNYSPDASVSAFQLPLSGGVEGQAVVIADSLEVTFA